MICEQLVRPQPTKQQLHKDIIYHQLALKKILGVCHADNGVKDVRTNMPGNRCDAHSFFEDTATILATFTYTRKLFFLSSSSSPQLIRMCDVQISSGTIPGRGGRTPTAP